MTNLTDLTACDALDLLRGGKISATELIRACLDRIAALEPVIGAWTHLAPELALANAERCDAEKPSGALHGLPIGIKDILDTADMPTSYGSPIYQGWQPLADAAAVTILRRAGAIVLGKTVTTEFACGSLVRTANGIDPDRTSGGSSAGSCAAVASRMIPFAIGTQSASSTIRPASYNGLIGMRPSMGLISVAGFKYFNGSFDTIGLIAREVDDVELLFCAQLEIPFTRGTLPGKPPTIAICRPSWLDRADPIARQAIDSAADKLAAAGADIIVLQLPPAYDDLIALHQDIQAFEAARSYAFEYENHRPRLDARVAALIEAGQKIPFDRYRAMLLHAQTARQEFPSILDTADAILTAAAPGEAPFGWHKLGDAFSSMGDTTQSRVWTLLQVPAITVPALCSPGGLPVGIQLIGRFGDDQRLLHLARWTRAAIGDPLKPTGAAS